MLAYSKYDWHINKSPSFSKILGDIANVKIRRFDDLHMMVKGESVVYLQYLPDRLEINPKNRYYWIPMYDLLRFSNIEHLTEISNKVKVISFSNSVTRICEAAGFDVIEVKYFPETREPNNFSMRENRIFYWNRLDIYSWEFLEKLCYWLKADGLHVFQCPDPATEKKLEGAKIPERLGDAEVTVEYGWKDGNSFYSMMDDCAYFLAPRCYEGIGLAMLEAMTTGAVCFSPNMSAMNEYIKHNETGYLFLGDGHEYYLQEDQWKMLFLNQEWINVFGMDAKNVSKNSIEYCEKGRYKWMNKEVPKIREFLKID